MKTQTFLVLAGMFLLIPFVAKAQKQFEIASPDGKLKAVITLGDEIQYSILHEGDVILEPSPISMSLTGRKSAGIKSTFQKESIRTNNSVILSPFYKRAEITDHYREMTLKFKEDFSLVFRAYNEGIAYRFLLSGKKPFKVENEQATFRFPKDATAYVPYVKRDGSYEDQFFNSFENKYSVHKLSEWDTRRLAFLPLLVEAANGKKVCITESELTNYPGMYLLNNNSGTTLKGYYATYPKEVKQGGHNNLQLVIETREPFIAQYNTGTQDFPWRIIVVSENDAELLDNDMVYKLAAPSKLKDISWIKPGKVAWEWWNTWNLYDVDFKTGINNETYKYYIDFAAKYGIEYVILDEGWAVNMMADLFQVVPEINLPELVAYGKARNVGLILWAGYHAFDRELERVCRHYSEMGIKGFKVDFMDRDDQVMVDFHRRAAEMSARYNLLVDFHGTYKPVGLNRTYPNVVNYEGVNGLEQLKWSGGDLDQVTYDVTMPYIRMLAGPVDYTQGAMRNATRGNYRAVYSEAMSQGTRCRQLAEYVIFESPLNMLCDNPSNYMREEECTEFIATIPTVWDNTVALDGKVGEYIVIARRNGDTWYVGALTNWDARTLEIDLSFLGEGNYTAEVFRDGINAGRAARDYKKEEIKVPASKKLTIKMESGGGWAANFKKGF